MITLRPLIYLFLLLHFVSSLPVAHDEDPVGVSRYARSLLRITSKDPDGDGEPGISNSTIAFIIFGSVLFFVLIFGFFFVGYPKFRAWTVSHFCCCLPCVRNKNMHRTDSRATTVAGIEMGKRKGSSVRKPSRQASGQTVTTTEGRRRSLDEYSMTSTVVAEPESYLPPARPAEAHVVLL